MSRLTEAEDKSPRPPRSRCQRRVWLLSAALLATAGCSRGIAWHPVRFSQAMREAQKRDQLVFVYLRHWTSIACTRFEEQVLSHPAVLSATRELYCVPLDLTWDRELARQWGVREVPAVVIFSPDGRQLATLSGSIKLRQLLDAIATAKAQVSRYESPP